jgi:hypothetical protein
VGSSIYAKKLLCVCERERMHMHAKRSKSGRQGRKGVGNQVYGFASVQRVDGSGSSGGAGLHYL